MKKNLLLVAAICICTMAMVSKASGQQATKFSFLSNSRVLENAMTYYEPAAVVNAKALRDFKRNFPEVLGAEWYTLKDGYVARFASDGIQNLIAYNKGGSRQYSISYYGEKKMDPDLRAMVKSTYYDYTISGIEEVHVQDQTLYLVHMQDENTWKKLLIADGDMQVVEDFNKK